MNTNDSDSIQPDTPENHLPPNYWMAMNPTGPEYTAVLQRILSKTWWELEDVAVYVRKTTGAAKIWMYRNGVRKCSIDKKKTCKEYVDAALNRRS